MTLKKTAKAVKINQKTGKYFLEFFLLRILTEIYI